MKPAQFFEYAHLCACQWQARTQFDVVKRLLIYNILAFILLALCPLTTNAQNIMRGDVNADGIINAADLVELINHFNGKTTPQFHLEYADMNKDGFIDRSDARDLALLITAMEPRPLDGKAICIGTEAKDRADDVPSVVTISKECAIIGLTNDKGETIFLLFDFMNYISYILCPTDNGFLLAPYDPTTDEAGNKLICWQTGEDKNYVAVVDEDPTNHEIVCDTLCVAMRMYSVPLRKASPPSVSSTESMVYDQMANLYGYVGNGTADVTDVTGIHEQVLPGRVVTKPSDVSGLISKKFSALSERYRGLSLGVTISEEVISEGEDNVLKMMFGDKNKAVAITKHILSIIQRHTDVDMKDLWIWSSDDDEPEDPPYIDMGYNPQPAINNAWKQRSHMANMQIPDLTQQQAYRVEVKVTDIKATSAVISGSYKEVYPEGSIINMGYVIEGPNSTQDVSAFGLSPTTIQLEPDTKYTVYAYLASASAPGGRYMSQPVAFKTKADESFTLSTTDVEFEAEGGSMTIDVYAPEGVAWSVQDVPSWLKVTTTDNTITIRAYETDEERDGEFRVEVIDSNGKKKDIYVYVLQWGPEPDISDLDSDIIFEGDLELSYDHNHWVNGEAHPSIEQGKQHIIMGFTMDEGHAYLSIATPDGIFTVDLADPVTALTMLTGERFNGERKKDGWRYVLTTKNFDVKDDEVRLDWTIDGDWVVDEKGNTTSDVSYNIKGSGYSKNVGYIAISGLTTDSPVLDWFDATESEVEYTYTYDFLDQKTHYKSHDMDYTMGQLQGHWNDDDE